MMTIASEQIKASVYHCLVHGYSSLEFETRNSFNVDWVGGSVANKNNTIYNNSSKSVTKEVTDTTSLHYLQTMAGGDYRDVWFIGGRYRESLL